MATEAQLRQKVVDIITGWVGIKEGSSGHKKILSIYNSYSPLPRGVKMLDSYAWCAATVSAAFIEAGLTDIGFVECSCSRMIELYKAKGRWKETDSYKPQIGDVMMYDWGDAGSGDCTGAPEHVGIVTAVSGTTIKVTEGNYNDAVGVRTMKVNGKYIRGYCLPDYASKATKEPNKATSATSVKVDGAKSGPLARYAKTWTVTASKLHLRTGAGTKKTSLGLMPTGVKVRCYGYYTKESDGTVWLLVAVQSGELKGKTGFCSKQYLN